MDERRTDRDIIVCIEEKIKELRHQFDNHLAHHWAITIAAISAGIIGFINFGIAMILFYLRK